MNKIVIYPGRFQPMLSHHVAVYNHLKQKFSDAEIFVGSSDKVDEGSPFNFKEKQAIAGVQGIENNKFLFAQQPYVHTFYKQFDHDNTVVIFAVGQKDMQTRFAMNNIDPETGLDLKVKPNKETGEHDPKYYQMINSMDEENPKPMSERGYLYEVPNIESDGEISSASAFRSAIKNSPDKEAAKEIFNREFKEYNEGVFNLVYNKLAGEKMSENINILRRLAGLEENSPIEFESHVNLDDITFSPISKSSSFHSMANRFDQWAKTQDNPEDKSLSNRQDKTAFFVDQIIKSPASVLSEINERIKPDENGLEASEKLTKIINVVEKEGATINDLNADDKKFTMDLCKKAIKEMDIEAGDDTKYEPEGEDTPKEETIDLSDIRSDYGVEDIQEGGECYDCDGDDEDCKSCEGSGYVQFDDDPNEPSQEEIDANYSVVKKYIMKGKKKDESVDINENMNAECQAEYKRLMTLDPQKANKFKATCMKLGPNGTVDQAYSMMGESMYERSDDSGEPSIRDMSDEDLMDYVGQKEEDLIDDMQQYLAPDFLHKDNFEEMFDKYREEVLEPAAHEISQDHAADNMDYDVDAEESIEDTSNKAVDAAMEELRKLAGLEEKEKTEPCPKCGAQRIMLKACATCGCS